MGQVVQITEYSPRSRASCYSHIPLSTSTASRELEEFHKEEEGTDHRNKKARKGTLCFLLGPASALFQSLHGWGLRGAHPGTAPWCSGQASIRAPHFQGSHATRNPPTSHRKGCRCQPFEGEPKAWRILETSRREMSASCFALRGRECRDFAEPRIRAHCLTAGLNRLDVNLRPSQGIQGVAAASRNVCADPWVCSLVVAPSRVQPGDILGTVPWPPFCSSPRGVRERRGWPNDRRPPSCTERVRPFSAASPTPKRGTPEFESVLLFLCLSPSLWSQKCQGSGHSSPLPPRHLKLSTDLFFKLYCPPIFPAFNILSKSH